jgi:hypothetical protein
MLTQEQKYPLFLRSAPSPRTNWTFTPDLMSVCNHRTATVKMSTSASKNAPQRSTSFGASFSTRDTLESDYLKPCECKFCNCTCKHGLPGQCITCQVTCRQGSTF